MIKFVSDLRQVGGFFWVLWFPPPIKQRHNIAEILLKVVLSTIKPTNHYCDLWTAPGTVILTETLILSEPQSTLVRGHSQVNAWWISLVQINV